MKNKNIIIYILVIVLIVAIYFVFVKKRKTETIQKNINYTPSQVNNSGQNTNTIPEPVITHEGGTFYLIHKGDTLGKIAKKYSTTVANLMRLNPQIKNKNLIYAGQKIRIS